MDGHSCRKTLRRQRLATPCGQGGTTGLAGNSVMLRAKKMSRPGSEPGNKWMCRAGFAQRCAASLPPRGYSHRHPRRDFPGWLPHAGGPRRRVDRCTVLENSKDAPRCAFPRTVKDLTQIHSAKVTAYEWAFFGGRCIIDMDALRMRARIISTFSNTLLAAILPHGAETKRDEPRTDSEFRPPRFLIASARAPGWEPRVG